MDVQYDMALDAMNELTGGQAEMLGAIEVTTEQVDEDSEDAARGGRSTEI
jgi:hypothetical protein